MANGISFVNVIVTEDFKKEYNIALAQEGQSMKAHIVQCMEELIIKHKKKKK